MFCFYILFFSYQSIRIFEQKYDDCTNGQNFTFTVPLNSSSISILINGQLNDDPVYIQPNGSIFYSWGSVNLFNDYTSYTRLDFISRECDRGENLWKYVNGKCYAAIIEEKSWKDAQTVCLQNNSTFVTIFNQKKNEWLDCKCIFVFFKLHITKLHFLERERGSTSLA